MGKIILNTNLSVELSVKSLIGETDKQIKDKLNKGEYALSILGTQIHNTDNLGSASESIVAIIEDKEIMSSDDSFEL
jgi:hypothetical protein